MRQIKIHDKAIYDRRDRLKYKMPIICISLDPQFSIMPFINMCSASPKFQNERKLNSLLQYSNESIEMKLFTFIVIHSK